MKVEQLEKHFNVKAKYLGAPSFAYDIQTGIEAYTIDREWKIKNLEGIELEIEAILQNERTEKKVS